MTSTQLCIVRVEGSETRLKKLLKHVKDRATKIVRAEKSLYIGVPGVELGWVDKIARDIGGIKKVEVNEFPINFQAPCGVFTTQLKQHTGRCKACAALRPSASKDSRVMTVATVPGLKSMSLQGLVDLMKQKMDEALSLAGEYDTALKALESIPGLQTKLSELQAQVNEHKQALRCFIEGK